MGKFRVKIEGKAKQDIARIHKSGHKATIKKLEKIVLELAEHPCTGIGNPEELKYDFAGLWSRRLNKKDGIIYEIFEELENQVVVISALGHY
jgi:toxin YoeB